MKLADYKKQNKELKDRIRELESQIKVEDSTDSPNVNSSLDKEAYGVFRNEEGVYKITKVVYNTDGQSSIADITTASAFEKDHTHAYTKMLELLESLFDKAMK